MIIDKRMTFIERIRMMLDEMGSEGVTAAEVSILDPSIKTSTASGTLSELWNRPATGVLKSSTRTRMGKSVYVLEKDALPEDRWGPSDDRNKPSRQYGRTSYASSTRRQSGKSKTAVTLQVINDIILKRLIDTGDQEPRVSIGEITTQLPAKERLNRQDVAIIMSRFTRDGLLERVGRGLYEIKNLDSNPIIDQRFHTVKALREAGSDGLTGAELAQLLGWTGNSGSSALAKELNAGVAAHESERFRNRRKVYVFAEYVGENVPATNTAAEPEPEPEPEPEEEPITEPVQLEFDFGEPEPPATVEHQGTTLMDPPSEDVLRRAERLVALAERMAKLDGDILALISKLADE